jgi:glutamyl-tRNA reductase
VAVLALGVSYRLAPVEVLERLAFSEDDLPKAYHHLATLDPVEGAVVLSTCNRVEVYADVEGYHTGFRALKSFLAESREVPTELIDEPLYSHYEEQAAEHLFSVAAGIASMVLGEPQILSQVRRALRLAEAERHPGSLLTQLFRSAVRSGRRARAETRIGASPAAFVEAGAILAERVLKSLGGRSLLVVGAGAMGELAARTLAARGAAPITVVSRSPGRARRLAEQVGGTVRPFAELEPALAAADLAVSSTSSTGVVIRAQAVRRAMAGRGSRALFLLDLGVPRDVDPTVAGLGDVHLADIDDLRDLVDREDPPEMDAVRSIVAEEVSRFTAWRRATRLAPLIRALHDHGERIREGEVRRAARRLASLSDEEWEAVEALTRGIVAKLLHDPVATVKALHDPGDARARLLAELFALDSPS